jgi:hypothetical protein
MREPTQIWYSGSIAVGSSRVAIFRSIRSGVWLLRKAIWVPQLAQKSRRPVGEEEYVLGSPAVYENAAAENDAHANTGAPLERWQSLQ